MSMIRHRHAEPCSSQHRLREHLAWITVERAFALGFPHTEENEQKETVTLSMSTHTIDWTGKETSKC
jgi:hypothetical protein